MSLPAGSIILWSGAIVDIPAGWILCDGAGASPNLRNKFIVGAGGLFAVDATGGADTHTHTFTATLHKHTIPAGSAISAGANYKNETEDRAVTGTTNDGDGRPPWYALAYIMKT